MSIRPYRAWSLPDLALILVTDLGLVWWQILSRRGDAPVLVLVVVLAVMDWRGLWTCRSRRTWWTLAFLVLLSSTAVACYVVVYVWYAWRDHVATRVFERSHQDTPGLQATPNDRLAFHPRWAERATDRGYYPLEVFDDVTLAWSQLHADGIAVRRQHSGRWELDWPLVVYAQFPQKYQGVTTMCFVLTPEALSGYVLRIAGARGTKTHVALEVFLRTEREVAQWV